MCPHKVDVNAKFDLNAIQNIAQHRRAAIEQCIDALTHSCLCHDAFCRRTTCTKMKRVVIHTSICKRKLKGNCPICRQLIALCCYHAKNCRIDRCAVPFCTTVKLKLRQQHLMLERVDAARGIRPGADPDESDAIDVNMSGSPVFGDEVPSNSGGSEPDANESSNACVHGYATAGPSGSDQPGPSGLNVGPCEICRAGPSGEASAGISGAGDNGGGFSGADQAGPSGVGEAGPSGAEEPGPSGAEEANPIGSEEQELRSGGSSPAGLRDEDMDAVNVVHIRGVSDSGTSGYYNRGASYAIAIEINNIAYPLYAVRDVDDAGQSGPSSSGGASTSGASEADAGCSKDMVSPSGGDLLDDISCER